MKVNLPIIHPPIDNVARNAYLLASVLHNKDFEPWFFNNYIQIFSDEGFYIDFDLPGYSDPRCIQWMNFTHIQRDFLVKLDLKIEEFIMKGIMEGYYIHLFLDEYFIPSSEFFQERNFPHNILIHGFDSEKGIFHIAGFFGTQGKFVYNESITQQELVDSFKSVDPQEDDLNGLILFKATPKNTVHANRYANFYGFNIQFVADTIKDYLHSRQNMDYVNANHRDVNQSTRTFGIAVTESLERYLDLLLTGERKLGRRTFYTLHQHKVTMLSRIKFMKQNNYIKSDADYIIDRYSNITKITKNIENIMIKFMLTQDRDLIGSAKSKIRELVKEEKQVLHYLLTQLNI
ncbi:hypothetical protein ACPV3A_22165 [Paenibacillus sp. Dod16]|uniref:hypothetical protein n=1 Tax=Paenibacillus sp. Dod16 TaxID=3416392 RepID=UPI003CF80755